MIQVRGVGPVSVSEVLDYRFINSYLVSKNLTVTDHEKVTNLACELLNDKVNLTPPMRVTSLS